MRPEQLQPQHKRLNEGDFSQAVTFKVSENKAAQAKSISINRSMMQKNVPLEEDFEPKLTTKVVTARHASQRPAGSVTPLDRQKGSQAQTARLNIITGAEESSYRQYMTQERANGTSAQIPVVASHKRKSLVSQFHEKLHGAKYHKEFHQAQMKQPTSLYGFKPGLFAMQAATSQQMEPIIRQKMAKDER